MPKLMVSVEDSDPDVFSGETLTAAIAQMLSVAAEVLPLSCDFELAELLEVLAELARKVDDDIYDADDPVVHDGSIAFDEIKLAWQCQTWDQAQLLFDAE